MWRRAAHGSGRCLSGLAPLASRAWPSAEPSSALLCAGVVLSAAGSVGAWSVQCQGPEAGAQFDASRFDAARWGFVLARIKGGIVSLKINSVRAFDTHKAGASQATGFVVDAEQGLILTNRHVVTEGPVVALALFDNHEEVELKALYRDPVHDFGIFKYDPTKLGHATVPELRLRPDKAVQGLDVRVIGNNAGEKLSVLGAMLARLDREAPFYGRGTYNDFNTFYFQAASATSGGSSGSPVVDSDGDVVALNAAGKTGTASSYYLPLDRAARAVALVRQGKPVSRGTLQTTFAFTPFSELSRLGLSNEEANRTREAGEEVGMLVVKSLVPEGPASGILEPGDVLVHINGVRVTRFTPLEEILDISVGEELELHLERGGQSLLRRARAQDLHSILPQEYLECGDAVFNNLSYHVARTYNVPISGVGVYVASQGYMLRAAHIHSGSLILRVGQHRTTNIRELEEALAAHPDGAFVPVHFCSVSDLAHQSVSMIRIDRTWFPSRHTVRDTPELGFWESADMPPAPAKPAPRPAAKTRFAPGANDVEQKLVRSLVKISASVPLSVDGTPSVEYTGNGLLVDAEQGLVICDRNTVPGMLSNATLTFGSSCVVPGHVVYIHPLHNLVVISYDTGLVDRDTIQAAKLAPSCARDLDGKKFWHLTTTGSSRGGWKLVSDKATAIECESHPSILSTPPRWQETNIELISLRGGAPLAAGHDGVVANEEGEVVAYWGSFLTQFIRDHHVQDGSYFAGIPSDIIEEMLEPLRRGERPPPRHALGAELEKLSLAAIRDMLMDAELAEEVEGRCKVWPPKAMSVRRRWADTDAHKLLRDNDLILEANGQPIETFRDLDRAIGDKPQVKLLIVRGAKKLSLDLSTVEMKDSGEASQVVIWCGAVLQEPLLAVATQRGQPRCGVYVASRFSGSPASMYGLPTMSRIIQVDGHEVDDMQGFLRLVSGKKCGDNVRIKHLDLRGTPRMTCLRVDSRYWPTEELRREDGPRQDGDVERYRWQRFQVSDSASGCSPPQPAT